MINRNNTLQLKCGNGHFYLIENKFYFYIDSDSKHQNVWVLKPNYNKR